MRRLVALTLALAGLALLGAGCNDDGREMRPARADQDGSVSTTGPPTTPLVEDDFFDTVATVSASTVTVSAGPTSSDPASGTASPTSTTLVQLPAVVVTAPWRDAAPIDPRYTCKGDNVAPALSWTDRPEGTQEIAVTMVDEDASFEHWAMTGIAPDVTGLAENETPAGAVAGVNGRGDAGYTGPCPPAGATHTYRITVHYLDHALGLASGISVGDMRAAIEAATLASAQVTGTFTGS